MTAKPPGTFKVACVQVNTSNDMAENIANASAFARAAVKDGADLIVLPENVSMMEKDRDHTRAKAMPEERHAALTAFRKLAPELGVWLHAGSLAVALTNGKLANRTYVIDPQGQIAARYDKIHMFDVDLGNGERYAESATFQAGGDAESVTLPWGILGLTICYDMRFPGLYRHLARAGADFIAVPSAFTRPTGEAHWHVLLRARAIETGCFIFAIHEAGGEHIGGGFLAPDPGLEMVEIQRFSHGSLRWRARRRRRAARPQFAVQGRGRTPGRSACPR